MLNIHVLHYTKKVLAGLNNTPKLAGGSNLEPTGGPKKRASGPSLARGPGVADY